MMIGTEDVTLLLARLLLAAMFVVSALDKFRLDPVEMGQISSLHLPAPAALERVTGVCEMVGATGLFFGVYARIAAAALALFVVFVSFMFVQFWSFKGPADARVMVRNLFVGNVAVVGGLLYVATVGAGRLAFVDI
jgi:putative oxidoreductase